MLGHEDVVSDLGDAAGRLHAGDVPVVVDCELGRRDQRKTGIDDRSFSILEWDTEQRPVGVQASSAVRPPAGDTEAALHSLRI